MPKIKYKDINLGLVRGRHELPVDDYIFDQIDNVLDFENLEKTAQKNWLNIKRLVTTKCHI